MIRIKIGHNCQISECLMFTHVLDTSVMPDASKRDGHVSTTVASGHENSDHCICSGPPTLNPPPPVDSQRKILTGTHPNATTPFYKQEPDLNEHIAWLLNVIHTKLLFSQHTSCAEQPTPLAAAIVIGLQPTTQRCQLKWKGLLFEYS